MKNMKSILKYLLVGVMFIQFASCEEDLLNEEHYKKIIYLKSGDNNIFSYPHALNDSLTTGYITVGSGGSMPLDNDVLVKLVMDEDAIGQLESYNYRYFGEEYGKYAQMLKPERYVLPSFDIILRAGQLSATTYVPIQVDANGLSPDTTYMLPLRIQSVEGVEINEEKNFVLYEIKLENKYSSVKSRTYKMRGTRQPESASMASNITTNKELAPLSKNEVRIFPENLNYSTDLATIERSTIVLTIHDDNKVTLRPYRTIKVEQLEDCTYDPEEKLITINYKYRRASDSEWITVHERLYRIE